MNSWQTFLFAVGLVFVLEGTLPFLSPKFWRRMMYRMMIQSDRTLRIYGLVSMLIGLTVVYLLHLNS